MSAVSHCVDFDDSLDHLAPISTLLLENVKVLLGPDAALVVDFSLRFAFANIHKKRVLADVDNVARFRCGIFLEPYQ